MESFSKILNIVDQSDLVHLKTINIQEYIKDFEMAGNGQI